MFCSSKTNKTVVANSHHEQHPFVGRGTLYVFPPRLTGKGVSAATIPGKCAAPPAPAIMTFIPRSAAVVAYSYLGAVCHGSYHHTTPFFCRHQGSSFDRQKQRPKWECAPILLQIATSNTPHIVQRSCMYSGVRWADTMLISYGISKSSSTTAASLLVSKGRAEGDAFDMLTLTPCLLF